MGLNIKIDFVHKERVDINVNTLFIITDINL